MDDYTRILTAAFPLVREVRLYRETLMHVMREHPEVPIELPSLTAAVERALQYPAYVELGHSNSYVFVDEGSTNRSGDPLRIPVKIISGASARVKTVYFAAAAGVPRTIVWRRTHG